MKPRLIITLIIATLFCPEVFGWGALGHDAIAYIAECNLTPKAKANIERYLGNRSIVYYASWMDMVRNQPHYRHTSPWHAFDIDSTGHYIPSKKRDAIKGLAITTEKLRNHKNMTDSAVADNIKILVHIVGDIHCPAHAFDAAYPQKSIKFTLNKTPYQVHSFWDGASIDHHRWNYLEYQHQLDRATPEEKEAICNSTPEDWANESAEVIRFTYSWFENGANYNNPQTLDFRLMAQDLAHPRLMKAGYRLAHLLNELFDY